MSAVSEPLAAVLRAGREHFNAAFATARRQHPGLVGESFRAFLLAAVDPLARAVHAHAPDRVADVVQAAYAIGLELCGKGLAGPTARLAALDQGWARLPALAGFVAAAPGRVLAAISNALVHLGSTAGARPQAWIEELVRLAPACADVGTLLAVGQVAAWRAGLAHHRAGALAVADRLPPGLAAAAVGGAGQAWDGLRARLAADPWFVPGDATPAPLAVGAFSGFGGLFLAPPRVAAHGTDLLVASGDETWLLTADAFGATFHRATPDEARAARFASALPADVAHQGRALRVRGRNVGLAGDLTSVATTATTLALTTTRSHAVVLVPLTGAA